MNGMNKFTGKTISGMAYLQQRIDTLLTTPRMTRIARRAYAGIFNAIDKPVNKSFLVDLYADIAVAIKRWEPELKIKRVALNSVSQGQIEIVIDGQYREIGVNSAQLIDVQLTSTLRQGQ